MLYQNELRSRPIDCNVVCSFVAKLNKSKNRVTEWPCDCVTKWPSDRETKGPMDRVTKWMGDRMIGSFADDWPDCIFLIECTPNLHCQVKILSDLLQYHYNPIFQFQFMYPRISAIHFNFNWDPFSMVCFIYLLLELNLTYISI